MRHECPSNPISGYHKYAAIKFLDKRKQTFIQACRYCGYLRAGAIIMQDGTPAVKWSNLDQYEG